MQKNLLIGFLLSCLFVIFFSISAIVLYFRTDVEKLVGNYPYFDQKSQSYELTAKIPDSYVLIQEVNYFARWAIIVSEDWAFYDHDGLDLNQILIVLKESWDQRKLVRGASTITQQLVKNVILTPEKTLWRKFREMILAYKLEKFSTKDKILEKYLNIAEFGDGIYGIKDASEFYFKKHPSELTPREGAFLAMLLPSPKKYSESFKLKELTQFASKQIEDILIKLRQAGIYTEEDRMSAMQTRFYWETQDLTLNETQSVEGPHKQQ